MDNSLLKMPISLPVGSDLHIDSSSPAMGEGAESYRYGFIVDQ